MSRSWIIGGVAVLAVIGLVNIVLLLRQPASHEVKAPPSASATPVAVAQNVPAVAATASTSATAAPAAATVAPANNFIAERETISASGKLRLVYTRDPKQKLHRISVATSPTSAKSFLLWEGKGIAWALVSPDDQWIAVDQHMATSGRLQLFHHSNGDQTQFEPVEPGDALADRVWQSFLAATGADPQTPRTGVTIDATEWNPDSRALGVTVGFLRTSGETEVAEPWSCAYDIATGQVTPSKQTEAFAQEPTASSGETQLVAMNGPDGSQPSDGESDEEELPGEKFPATRMVPLTVPDVNESSLDEINYAINEMFARHGATFKDKKVGEEFSQFAWYQPQPGLTSAQVESQFDDLEKENLKVLARCRDAKLAAAKRNRARHAVRAQRVQEPSPGEQLMRSVLQGVMDSLQNQ